MSKEWQRPREFLPDRFDPNSPLFLTPDGKKRKPAYVDEDAADIKPASAESLAKGRKERAQRRAAGAAVQPPAKRPRAATKPKAPKPPEELSAYEKKRDQTRAENEKKLKDLGL